MLTNYIKLAWRVLGRKKFFTFISLFGISFTLGILMVIFSFLQGELGTDSPLSNKDKMVIIETLRLETVFYDTVPTIDTTYLNGVTIYDTTLQYNRRGAMRWNSDMNNKIAEEYLNDLPSVNTMTVISGGSRYDVYVNGIKQSLETTFADPKYWEVFNHKIIEGRVFNQSDMDQSSKVLVISDKAAINYFGFSENVVGKEMYIDGSNYEVIGMYPDQGKVVPYVSPDIVIPYTNMPLENQPSFYHGYFSVVFVCNDSGKIKELKSEIENAASIIPMDHPSKPAGYNDLILLSKSYDEMYAQHVYDDEDPEKSHMIMKWVLIGLLVFFIMLPTLNLINLNVSRIMERSSEIGVRKAFGAHQGNIITQFIIENIFQTVLGGLIGLGLATAFIYFINNSGYLGSSTMSLNIRFFAYCFIITIIFGVISGFLPAYRMSKLNIVNALKNNRL